MPSHQTGPVNERLKFVAAVQNGQRTMTELCEEYGISRKTGYKLLGRYSADGAVGLVRSIRHSCGRELLSRPSRAQPV